jgi:hypothetical protein
MAFINVEVALSPSILTSNRAGFFCCLGKGGDAGVEESECRRRIIDGN